MHSENTKFELKQFEVMSEILKQLKFVFFWFLKLLTEHLTYYMYVSYFTLLLFLLFCYCMQLTLAVNLFTYKYLTWT
jgi:hypothetical protein